MQYFLLFDTKLQGRSCLLVFLNKDVEISQDNLTYFPKTTMCNGLFLYLFFKEHNLYVIEILDVYVEKCFEL